MTEYKTILGYIATIIALFSYAIYFYGIFVGKTKPHAFTWFVWGTLNAIGFAAVTVAGGGNGAWVLAVNFLCNYAIAGIAFYQRRVKFVLFDWLALTGAILAIFLWWLTSNPLTAVIFISLSDSIGFLPTFRKAYHWPFEENVTSFFVGLVYYILAILALQLFTITTWLYPVVIVVVDVIFVLMVLIRRKQIKS